MNNDGREDVKRLMNERYELIGDYLGHMTQCHVT